jgi:chorismate lyase
MMRIIQESLMARVQKNLNNDCIWRPLGAWPVKQRPALWAWLQDAGSLTKRLRATAGPAFHVQVLHEGQTLLDAGDALLLHAVTGSAALIRQVYLCADTPWVYAQTLALTESRQWLERLGPQPLGDRIFANAAQRSMLEVAQLGPQHGLYQAALKGQQMTPSMLWARRSVLLVDCHRLLIYECFLPGMDS